MNFDEAIQAIRHNKRVRRSSWKNEKLYWYMGGDGMMSAGMGWATVCNDDIIAEDWEYYVEHRNFEWALEQVRQGHTVTRKFPNGIMRTVCGYGIKDGKIWELPFYWDDMIATDWRLA